MHGDMVLDTWRHRNVETGRIGIPGAGYAMSAVGGGFGQHLGTLDNTFTALENDRALAYGPISRNALDGGVHVGDLHHQVGLSPNLDVNIHGPALQRSMAELSRRRKKAIKAAFRRIDRGQGWVSLQEFTRTLQQLSHLGHLDQQRVIHAICGGVGSRVTYTQFLGYYQALSCDIQRDRDFEDLMRHHWGFPEVSDMLDDMKNKFAMVGLAYTFRQYMEKSGSPDLSLESFQHAMSDVGIRYSQQDMSRMFEAFNGDSSPRNTIGILKFTTHLTSAPRPSTPEETLYGTAHFSEVPSQGGTHPFPSPLHTSLTTSLHGSQQPQVAPPETQYSHGNFHEHPPLAPLEDDDDPSPAPTETGCHPDPPHAPPEDDGGETAPPEKITAAEHAEVEEVQLAPLEQPHHSAGHQSSSVQSMSYTSGGVHHSFSGGLAGGHSFHAGGHGNVAAPSSGHAWNLVSHSAQHHGALLGHNESYDTLLGNGGSHQHGDAVVSGRKRALTVGINYIGTQAQLAGCINDSDSFVVFLTQHLGFDHGDIRQLRDDQQQRMPSKKNISTALGWLVNGARPGDHLFFHYSGHGSQQRDNDGDEMDGKDETIVPVDYQRHGMLSDDELRHLLARPLPKGVRLTVVLDCCHSGTGMDLPYKVIIDASGQSTDVKKKSAHKIPRLSDADICMVSGCRDSQTSADIQAGAAGNDQAAGAMTTAFLNVMRKSPELSFHQVLFEMRRFLKERGYQQVPQLSSEHFLNLTECFMPEARKPETGPLPSLRPPARRALSVGINYTCLPRGHGRLSGCINDSDTMVGILRETFGFQETQIRRLRDDRQDMMPTKANMLAQLHWLTAGAGPGDEMFFHYSGHGGQQSDTTGDEVDGKDETLIPFDFQTQGQLTDDELHSALIRSLPSHCRLWVVLDCCHSGTALDLRFKVRVSGDGRTATFRKTSSRPGVSASKAEILLISGCKDSQTSADVQSGQLGNTRAAGAMTTALRHCLSPTISCEDLIIRMRRYLKQNHFDQVPQMSSEQFISLDCSFVDYQENRQNKRALRSAARALPVSSLVTTSPTGVPSTVPTDVDRIHQLEEELAFLQKAHSGSPKKQVPGKVAGPLGAVGLRVALGASPTRFGPRYF